MATAAVKRPKKIKIGYQTFEIQWLDEAKWLRANHSPDKGGAAYWGMGYIAIRLDISSDPYTEPCLKEVLLHEILHMAYEVAGLNKAEFPKDAEDVEEQFVGMLSFPMMQVLQDNPEVLNYLMTP